MKKTKIVEAIEYLGGINDAALKLQYSRQWIWRSMKNNKIPSIELCKRIEKITNGLFNIRTLRPDIFSK